MFNTPSSSSRSRRRTLILRIFGALMRMMRVHMERSLLACLPILCRSDAGGGGMLTRRRQHHDYTTVSANRLSRSSPSSHRSSLGVKRNPGLRLWIRGVLIDTERISHHLELGVGVVLKGTNPGRGGKLKHLDYIFFLSIGLAAS